MTNALAGLVLRMFTGLINDALSSGDVSGGWVAWSTAAESALVDAFCLAGGPVPERGFCLGRGFARFSRVRLGGPKVRKARARCADLGDGAQVDLKRECSIGPLADLRRRLRAVLDVISVIGRSGFTVSRGLDCLLDLKRSQGSLFWVWLRWRFLSLVCI